MIISSYAHGCNSLMYFRYRGATKGAEQYCYRIIDQDNKKRRKFHEVQERIREFVKNGGKVVFSFRTAIKDYYNNLTLGQYNPSFYTDLIGGFVEEIESLQEGQNVTIKDINEF